MMRVREHVDTLRKTGKRVVFASYSAGAADRMKGVLEDHELSPVGIADSWQDIRTANKKQIAVTVLPIETGFETDDLAVISEQDVLGDRLVRKSRRSKKADNFLKEASALNAGDLVVHASHGIGRFDGLELWRFLVQPTTACNSPTTAATSCLYRLKILRFSHALVTKMLPPSSTN